MDSHPKKGNGAEQRLRDDIDSGRTGEKVDFPDPAAAPLGTDAEAGGQKTSPEAVRITRTGERFRSERLGEPKWRLALISIVIVVGAVTISVWAFG